MHETQRVDASERVRRRPKQRRSQQTVERILSSLEDLLVDHRPAELTIKAILEHSGVPAGTFYGYFPDKAAAIERLAFRYVEEVNEMLTAWRRDLTVESWRDVVEDAIRTYGSWAVERPAFVRLWTSDQLGGALVHFEQTSNELLGTLLREAVLPVEPAAADTPDQVFRFAIEMIDQMMRFSFRETDDAGRRQIEDQVVLAVTSYLGNHLPEPGGNRSG